MVDRLKPCLSERDVKLIGLAPVARAYIYESERVNNPLLDPQERINSKHLRDAFMEWMIEDSHKGGKILREMIAFKQWDFEQKNPVEEKAVSR